MPDSHSQKTHACASATVAAHSASVMRRASRARVAGYVFSPLGVALLACLAASPVRAQATPAATAADCNATERARTLVPAARTGTDARAYWLDRERMRWPGKPADGRYRLVFSADGRLVAEPGQRVLGADIALTPSQAGSLPPDVAERFKFVAPGATLALDARAAATVASHTAGQWLLVHEDARGHVLDATGLQWPGLLDDVYTGARQADLGLRVDDQSARFGVWAPTARSVALCVYDTGAAPAANAVPLRRDAATGVWSATLPGDLRGAYYTYLVDVFVPGTGLVRNHVTDPYSVSLTTDSTRSYIADLDDPALAPPGWRGHARPDAPKSLTDMAVYELHVRDFSIGDETVPAEHRGKYLAFADTDSNGMRHLSGLREAGLTDIHLLPVFDIATVPEAGCVTPQIPNAAPDSPAQQAAVSAVAARDCFNWGYDPYHFNAPEGSYASDAADGAARIREFRQMVMALHAAGLRVGMDVVYNHTTTSGQNASSVLDRIVPGYYHRLDANGTVERSTCCDNTATEHAMMARLMEDSIALWTRQYGIDSYRFDLMGHQPRSAMEAIQARLQRENDREIPLIGEGWNFGEVMDGARFVQASQNSLGGTGIGTFSDRARDALRGGGCCDSGKDLLSQQGYLNGLVYAPNVHADPKRPRSDLLHAADLARAGLAGTLADYETTFADGRTAPLSKLDYKGQPAGYASQPGEVVNYTENHDNLTLFDLNAPRLPEGTSREERARVQALGAAFVALSQGMAYFHAGQDVLRSKSLDRNSFDSGDWFNRLDWTYRDNGFAAGLPKAEEGEKDWPLLAPVLRDASIKPTKREIEWTRDAFRDWLRIRASTPLLRLTSTQDVQQRLRFANTGPEQNPVVIAGHLDGQGLPGARFSQLLYLINVSPEPQSLVLPSEAGKRYVLHPVQRDANAADARPREQARFDSRSGRFSVPPRTAVVYVIE
ncbi:alpha-1,6-glucosidase domain-containing protein [Lysobacter korlensis]|uniref:Alpha-1,6-glucosidase domain-containing protein n=1 Tax=Lysobacter korlensis TaxID=553636 RepID=A0ABV6RKQ8_9GAMM